MRTRDAKEGETRSTSGFRPSVKEIVRTSTTASDKRLSVLRRRDQKLCNYREKQRYRNRREKRGTRRSVKKSCPGSGLLSSSSFPSQNSRTLAREEEVGQYFLVIVHVSLVAVANAVANCCSRFVAITDVVMDGPVRTVPRWIDGSTGRFDQPLRAAAPLLVTSGSRIIKDYPGTRRFTL